MPGLIGADLLNLPVLESELEQTSQSDILAVDIVDFTAPSKSTREPTFPNGHANRVVV